MIYLYWYLGIGVTVFLVGYGVHHLSTRKGGAESHRELLAAANVGREKLSDRILDKLVVPALAAITVVGIWPVIVITRGKEIFWKSNRAPADDKEFSVLPAHLLERLTVKEIEARETVYDPLDASPNLAFGHLNGAWCKFVNRRTDGDELWSFGGSWQTVWGFKEHAEGYVLVQGGNPGAHFLTVRKALSEKAACCDSL